MEWWHILLIALGGALAVLAAVILLYRPIFKRFFDILLSAVALILLSWLFLILAILIRIKLGGPVLFRQPRPGKNGKVFMLHKFRTMTNAKDENGELLPDEERLTKFGKFLRATSLDELPEIWDIFRGKMSIIGPRPLRVEYLPLYDEEQAHRHDVRPGLTGLAQVNGRNAISWEKKFEYDVEYARHVNIFTDIAIFFKTVGKVFKRDGISQEGSATMPFFTGTKHINVLVTSCGRRVELVKAFKAARDENKIVGDVVCADCADTAPALAFADKKRIVPRISSGEYVDALVKIIEEEKISLVVPTIDTELVLLAENRERLEKSGARLLVPSAEAVAICCDKQKTAEFFACHGFDAPKTLTPEEVENYDGKNPLFVKPKDGSSSINAFKVKNEKELKFFTEYIDNPIVQECAEGQEYTVDILTDFSGEPVLIVPRARLAVRSGEILKGRIEKNEKIIETARRLVKELGYVGQLTAQGFLTDGGEFKLIEMNARFGGGATMSIKAGADFCGALYKMLRGDKVEYSDDYCDGTTIARFDDSVIVGGDGQGRIGAK
ncbi:MAG: ATP-grasp domain-containing protein [Clostridiales bacterium]|nr:ATP-grasp domain-containing protein [Clostridiales bacterium]